MENSEEKMNSQTTSPSCPMCGHEFAEWGDLRFHLHTRHAKSDLVEALVESSAARGEDVPLTA
jgi:hypothetical protein